MHTKHQPMDSYDFTLISTKREIYFKIRGKVIKAGGYQYEVLKILGGEGKSGMGVVYVCYDEKFHQIVMLKTFQDKILNSDEFFSLVWRGTHRERVEWTRVRIFGTQKLPVFTMYQEMKNRF